MNKIKSPETILDKWYKPRMHWKTFNRGQVIRAMEEYAFQFKQPDISEDVETDLEKDLSDEEFNNIANASYSLFPILTKEYKADMVSFQHGFEIGYKYKNRELAHKPTVDEDKDEDEFWNKVGAILNGSVSFSMYPKYLATLKQQFSITRK